MYFLGIFTYTLAIRPILGVRREQGSVSFDLKYKSLHQRWFGLAKQGKAAGTETPSKDKPIIKRGTIITAHCKASARDNSYVILGIYNKHYNKWFLVEQDDPQKLEAATKLSKTRIQLRRLKFRADFGVYLLDEWNSEGSDC